MFGLGVDMVHIPAFEKQLDDSASAFAEGTFTAIEWRYSNQKERPGRHLAVRYAAKEAVIKAWASTRWGRPLKITDVDLREREVTNDALGRPCLNLHGRFLEEIGTKAQIQLSMSHDGDYAIATAILVPPQNGE